MPNMLLQQSNRTPYAVRGLFAGSAVGADQLFSQPDFGCR